MIDDVLIFFGWSLQLLSKPRQNCVRFGVMLDFRWIGSRMLVSSVVNIQHGGWWYWPNWGRNEPQYS
jgi:hypothetical protein